MNFQWINKVLPVYYKAPATASYVYKIFRYWPRPCQIAPSFWWRVIELCLWIIMVKIDCSIFIIIVVLLIFKVSIHNCHLNFFLLIYCWYALKHSCGYLTSFICIPLSHSPETKVSQQCRPQTLLCWISTKSNLWTQSLFSSNLRFLALEENVGK